MWVLNLFLSSHTERNVVHICLYTAMWAEKSKSLTTFRASKIYRKERSWKTKKDTGNCRRSEYTVSWWPVQGAVLVWILTSKRDQWKPVKANTAYSLVSSIVPRLLLVLIHTRCLCEMLTLGEGGLNVCETYLNLSWNTSTNWKFTKCKFSKIQMLFNYLLGNELFSGCLYVFFSNTLKELMQIRSSFYITVVLGCN